MRLADYSSDHGTKYDGSAQRDELRTVPMLADCSRSELSAIDSMTTEVSVPVARVLASEHRVADQVLLPLQGRARLNRSGRQVGVLEAGSFFAAAETLSRVTNPATVVAASPMRLRVATAREFRSLVRLVPQLEMICQSGLPHVAQYTFGAADNERPDLDVGSVHAAIMFVDIVDSTARLERCGDATWSALLDVYVRVVEREVDRHRGRLVHVIGDGALASFDCGSAALRCALAIRDAARDLGIDIRAGVHCGEIMRRGDDICGIAVHIANRICSLAKPGRVLASRSLIERVVGADVNFDDAGTFTLKGVKGRWPLVSVVS